MIKMIKTSEDYERELNRSLLKVTIKKHQKINLFINIVLAVSCIFIFKLSVLQIALVMIGYDIIGVGLDMFISNFLAKRKNKETNVKKLEALINKYESMAETIQHNLDTRDYNHYERAELRDELSEIKEQIIILQKKLDEKTMRQQLDDSAAKSILTIENIMSNKLNTLINLAEQLTIYKNNKITSEMRENGISLDAIVEKTNLLIDLLKEKPEAISYAFDAYNSFATDLIGIFDSISKKSVNDKEQYYPQIKTIISEMEKHIDNVEYKIRHSDKIEISSSLNVLLDKLKSSNEANADKFDGTEIEGYKDYDGYFNEDMSDLKPNFDKEN